jgi:hypothetical protein
MDAGADADVAAAGDVKASRISDGGIAATSLRCLAALEKQLPY